MTKLRTAVIGVGAMGKNHARIYAHHPNSELVAISDIDKENGKKIAKSFDVNFYKDYKQMLDREKIDALSVCVPTNHHREVSIDVMNKNVHVLLEKPIAENVEDSQQIIKSAKKANVKLLIGHIERFNPAVNELKRLVTKNKLGNICSIIARRVGFFPPQINNTNIVIDVSVHDIDIIRYLMGGDPDEVYSAGGKSLKKNMRDHAVALLRYGVANAVIQFNWITPIKIRNLSVTGTKGYAELNYITQELVVYKANYKPTYDGFGDFLFKFGKLKKMDIPVKNKEPLMEEISHFIDCVQNDKIPLVTGEDALAALKIALDIDRKLNENKM